MKTALFLDFDDSFTFNVIQELTELGLKVRVIKWNDFQGTSDEELLILGPGPGHPDDYQIIFPLVKDWIDKEKPFFGVCLGHQIFWRLKGQAISRSKHPLHGQKIKLDLNKEWQKKLSLPSEVYVQRYNSLSVKLDRDFPQLKNFIQEGEVMMTAGKNHLSYQFHPESVGTSYRRSFFLPLLKDLV